MFIIILGCKVYIVMRSKIISVNCLHGWKRVSAIEYFLFNFQSFHFTFLFLFYVLVYCIKKAKTKGLEL